MGNFMKLINSIVLIFLLAGCSNVNTDSKEYYKFKHVPKHGIKLITESPSVKTVDSQESISRGKGLYQSNCLECHGPTGEGSGPTAKRLGIFPQNLKEQVANTPNFEFYINLSEWKGEMPGWNNQFTREELKDLAAYIKTF
jgi:mono/diheme cytochrome c family protein